MKLIDPNVEVLTEINGTEILKHVEKAIRNCYRSDDKICDGSANKLVKTILDSHHYSTIEHFSITVKVTCSRACMAQWTRHRHMSYSIESQRYVNYSRDKFGGEITFIKPPNFHTLTTEQAFLLKQSFQSCENDYLKLVKAEFKAQDARQVLNNAVKTEMIVTANLRAWRDFFKLRTEKSAQEEIRTLATDLLEQFRKEIPVIFDEL